MVGRVWEVVDRLLEVMTEAEVVLSAENNDKVRYRKSAARKEETPRDGKSS